MKIIPYGRQYIDNQDIKFVSKALKQDLITTGSNVKKFENQIKKLVQSKLSLFKFNYLELQSLYFFFLKSIF